MIKKELVKLGQDRDRLNESCIGMSTDRIVKNENYFGVVRDSQHGAVSRDLEMP